MESSSSSSLARLPQALAGAGWLLAVGDTLSVTGRFSFQAANDDGGDSEGF